MKKSTVVKILGAILLAAVLLAAASAVVTAQSYEKCAAQIIGSAPPADSQPPAAFRNLSRTFWGHRDLALAQILARECNREGSGGMRRLGSQLFGLGIVKSRLSWQDRVTLSSIYFPSPAGSGLTRAVQAEWDRPPASLSEAEMTWLFVLGQRPDCSKKMTNSEAKRQECEDLYKSLLVQALGRAGGAQSSNGG